MAEALKTRADSSSLAYPSRKEGRAADDVELFKALMGSGSPPDVFDHVTAQDKAAIIARANLRRLALGEQLYSQGIHHEHVHILRKGMIRAYYTAPAGREITLAYWPPGTLVGSPEIFGRCAHIWTGVAIEPSEVLTFWTSELYQLVERYPGLAIGIIEAIAYKCHCHASLIQLLGTRSIKERLLQIIFALCRQHGVQREDGSIQVNTRFTHEDLANMSGASRQWVTMTLNQLQMQGIIKLGARRLIVLRVDLIESATSHREL